jgi:hypothetical protein
MSQWTPERREQQRQIALKLNWSDKMKSVYADLKTKWEDPEYREKMLLAAKESHTPEMVEKFRQDTIKRNKTSGMKKLVSDAAKKRWSDPSFKEKMKSIQDNSSAVKQYREKQHLQTGINNIMSNPEIRKKQKENVIKATQEVDYRKIFQKE